MKDLNYSLIKLDYILIALLIIVYSFYALHNLGSMKSPETYYKAHGAGENFYVDLGKKWQIDKISYFLAHGEGSFTISYSVHRSKWFGNHEIGQENLYSNIEWRVYNPNVTARYVRFIAKKPGVMLKEVAFFEPSSKVPIPISRVVTGSVTLMSKGNPENVFDEPEKVSYNPSFMNSMYFDELYHARTAYEHLHLMPHSETTHPPLGKVIISAGIAIFGMNPFGWRIMGTIFGILMVPIMYIFGKMMFGRSRYAFISSFLMAFDFMHFVQTRISTIDVYATFFIILMFFFMYKFFTEYSDTESVKKSLLFLFLSGLFFGLGVASKWSVLYGGVGLAVIFFTSILVRLIEYLKTGEPQFIKRVFIYLFFNIFAFILIPCGIYLLSYLPYLMVPGLERGLWDVALEQKYMYAYHSQLTATHPFSSEWWTWPLNLRPVWYYSGTVIAGKISRIVAFGNPAVWWVGGASVAFALLIGMFKRDKWVYLLLVTIASLYVPWAISPRKLIFIYHFFPTVPFVILCLTYCLKILDERFNFFHYITNLYLCVVFILFAMFYPILSGEPVEKTFNDQYLKWFKTWI